LGWSFNGAEDAQATTSDTAFAGGTKQDDNCATVGDGKAPNKDDLKRFYLSSKTGANGHTYLNLAWVRIPQNTTSPSAHIGFEFNKATAGNCSTGGLAQRVAGDMLIVYDFEGGSGDIPVLTLRRWVTSGACEVGSSSPPCWGPAATLAAGTAEARVNTGATALDVIAPSDETLGINEFGEAGIDLTNAGVFTAGTCNSFGRAYAVSRSSGSSATAAMKDLAGPVNFNLTNCGQIKIIKQTNPRGLNQPFGFSSTIPNTSTCVQDATPNGTYTGSGTAGFALNDNGNSGKTAGSADAAQNSTGNTESCTDVPAGTYTVTEAADPTGFAFGNFTCTSNGTGTSTTPTSSTTQKNVSITIAGGGVVTCIYTNNQQTGAIKVAKVSIKTGNAQLAGATIAIKDPDGNHITGSPFTTTASAICVDGLTKLGTYTVQETAAPAGFFLDDNTVHNVSVTATNATCSGSPFGGATYTFSDTPKTDILVRATSQATTGGTESRITCVNSASPPANIGNSPQPSASTFANPAEVTANGVAPGTYTCTIIVDP
jgi:hypothetical protein